MGNHGEESFQAVSESEMEILRLLWENGGPMLLPPLLEAAGKKDRAWKRTTVQTFLARLGEKGMVAFKKRGRMSEYTALVSEEEYTARQTRAFLQKVYQGDAKNLVSCLIRQECLTAGDIEELKGFWRREGEGNA